MPCQAMPPFVRVSRTQSGGRVSKHFFLHVGHVRLTN